MAFGTSGGVRFLDPGGCSGSGPFRLGSDAPGGGSGSESSGWLSGRLGGSDSWIWAGALDVARFVLILMLLCKKSFRITDFVRFGTTSGAHG